MLFEPAMGLAGRFVYGLFHHEPLGLRQSIQWEPPQGETIGLNYYAAQGNCWRIFRQKSDPITKYPAFALKDTILMSALSYVASGGFSKPQLYPTALYPFIVRIERVLDIIPSVFATRMLVILEKEH